MSILAGHSALFLLKILYGDPLRGVADGYSLSRPHRNLRSRNFPAVRDGKSADTVIINGDVLRRAGVRPGGEPDGLRLDDNQPIAAACISDGHLFAGD